MHGQLINRGENTWQVRIPIGRDSRGKRLFHTRTVRGTKREAEQYRTKVLRELDTGTFVDASQEAFGGYLEQWLETSVRQRVRERTYLDYRSIGRRYLIPALGHRKLAQISPGEIQALYARLLDEGLSPRTVRYGHSVLHGALEQAVRWRKLPRNPAKLVDLPRLIRKEMRALSAEEAARFIDASTGTKHHALWLVLLTTGLRPGEALALKWADLDKDRVRVQRSLVRGGTAAWTFHEPKTPKARRVVTLPPSVRRLLQEHRVQQVATRLLAGTSWRDNDLIFSTRSGAPLDYRVVVQRHFKRLAVAANLPGLRPESSRVFRRAR